MDEREERIRQLAHNIWLEEGKPEGFAKDHWSRAQRQIDQDMEMERQAAPTRRSREVLRSTSGPAKRNVKTSLTSRTNNPPGQAAASSKQD